MLNRALSRCGRFLSSLCSALALVTLSSSGVFNDRPHVVRAAGPSGASVSILSVRVTPERPGPGTLCQLFVTIVNNGEASASRFRFAVQIDGRSVPAYSAAMHLDVVAAGETKEIRLYNFWAPEIGATSGPRVEVALASADWVRSEQDGGVRVWASLGPVADLPAAAAAVVRAGGADARSRPKRARTTTAASRQPNNENGRRETGFRDVTAEAGIRFAHERATFDARLAHIMIWVTSIHAGACAADYDRDGDVDFYLLTSKEGAPNALYRNDGTGRFVEVAERSGVADVNDAEGLSMVCAFADVDNDGHQDLLIGSYGRTRLFKGDASGRFTERGKAAGLNEIGNVSSAVFFDYDADGWLDLLLGRYFPHDMRRLVTHSALPATFHSARNGAPNLLYRNNRNGTFTEVGAALGVGDTGWTLAVAAGDLDNDGDADVYIANDFGPDVLYRNNGDGSFTDVSDEAIGPDNDAGMNAEMGDYDGDGLIDIYVTNITNVVLNQGNMLWRNLGKLHFVNMAITMGVRDGGWGWAAKFVDYDNDGDLDIYTVNGFVSDGPMDLFRRPGHVTRGFVSDIRSWPDMRGFSLSGHERNLLFRNEGHQFVEVGASEGVDAIADGRGIAPADIDGDGDVDMLTTNVAAPPIVYRNDRGQQAGWVAAELFGATANRDAIGARVTIAIGEQRLIRDVDGGSGYNAQGSRVVHVGLGEARTADYVEIRWPGGGRVRHAAIPARVKLIVTED